MSLRHYPTLRHEKMAIKKGYKIVAGIDESGVGPLAGPVVAAAVILLRYNFKNKIDDSKRLTAKKRLSAFGEILENSVYSVAVINRNIVDAINIYNASKLAMEKAVIGLSPQPDYILIDGRMRLNLPHEGLSIVQGDRKCLSIACASIIAKVWRDRIMARLHEIYPEYGFVSHKGYGTAMHLKTLRKYGPSPVHRLSFEPVRRQLR